MTLVPGAEGLWTAADRPAICAPGCAAMLAARSDLCASFHHGRSQKPRACLGSRGPALSTRCMAREGFLWHPAVL